MKLFLILFFSLTLFVRADTIIDMQIEQRVALIIGNNNYSGGTLYPLSNPKNDAQAIKKVLESRGFEVIYRANISKKEFKESIFEFNKKIEQGGVGLFYYAGHGIEVDNKNYLIPIDAKLKKKMDTEFESIELNYIIKGMQESKNRLNIIILDACRNNPFFDGRGSKGGLAEVKPIGLFVSYATGAGKIAQDNKHGKNGLFTKYLLEYMKQPLTLREVFYKTRDKVYGISHKEQFPAIYDQVVNSQFYFTLPNKSIILSSKEDTSDYSTLNIETTPKSAIVELVGLSHKYYKGIKLKNGRYKIKVSKYGYISKILEIKLKNKNKISIELNKEKIVLSFNQESLSHIKKIIIVSGIYNHKNNWCKDFDDITTNNVYNWATKEDVLPFNKKMIIDLGLYSKLKKNKQKQQHKNPSSILLNWWVSNKAYFQLDFRDKNNYILHTFKFIKNEGHNSAYIEFDGDRFNESRAELKGTIQGFIKIENNQFKFEGEHDTDGLNLKNGLDSKSWKMSKFNTIDNVYIKMGVVHTYAPEGEARMPLYIEY